MSTWHRMAPARPGPPKKSVPPSRTPAEPSPPPSPGGDGCCQPGSRSRSSALLLFRPGAGGTPAQALSYTSFVSDVTANKVSTAAITSAGSVSGKLHDGSAYTSQIPTALNDNALSALLLGHKVQVTGTSPSTTSVLGLLLELDLPLLVIVGLFVWISRRSSKQLTDGSAGSWASASRRPRSTTRTGRARASRTSPATRVPRPRSWKWWTS